MRFGIIGAGMIAGFHARAIAAMADAELVAVYARRAAAAAEMTGQFGGTAYDDLDAFLGHDGLDVVTICTPSGAHLEPAIAAARAGKHIICEKPLANTLPEAESMLEAVENAGVRHFLMHNYRRLPAVALAKRMIEDGRLGRIFHYRARYLQDWAMSEDLPLLWRFTKNDSGSGALGDLGAHIIDLGRHLCGEITDIAAATETFIKERQKLDGSGTEAVTVDDAVVMCTRFASGAIGTLEATRFAAGRKNLNTFEINGSKGSVVFDLENLNNLQYFSFDDDADAQGFRTIICCDQVHPYGGHWWPDGHIIGYEHSFTHSVYDFLMGMESGGRVRPDFDDGVRNQRVLDAAERAAESREWVKVE